MSGAGGEVSLDETSRAIGRLEAQSDATAKDVAELRKKTDGMDDKLDRLLARSNNAKLTLKHWLTILAASSAGGGGIAHALRKLLE